MACSGGSAGPPTVSELGRKAGCVGLRKIDGTTALEAAKCKVNGGAVYFATFTTNEWRDSVNPPGVLIYGDRWIVAVSRGDDAAELADILGGKVR